jgi:hypothetical protein
MTPTGFTQAQDDAFDRIEKIMREHFEGGAFTVIAEMENDHGKEVVRAGWHGGKCQSVGLFTYGADRARGLLPDGGNNDE